VTNTGLYDLHQNVSAGGTDDHKQFQSSRQSQDLWQIIMKVDEHLSEEQAKALAERYARPKDH
jgi:hypothetical protein